MSSCASFRSSGASALVSAPTTAFSARTRAIQFRKRGLSHGRSCFLFMLELICSWLNHFSRTITMASFGHKVIRSVFGAAEHVAPRLTGRVAFEIFCRTANPNAPSPGERKAIDQAARFMADARRHCLPLKSGSVTAFDFRPPAGAPGPERFWSSMAGIRAPNTCAGLSRASAMQVTVSSRSTCPVTAIPVAAG